MSQCAEPSFFSEKEWKEILHLYYPGLGAFVTKKAFKVCGYPKACQTIIILQS